MNAVLILFHRDFQHVLKSSLRTNKIFSFDLFLPGKSVDIMFKFDSINLPKELRYDVKRVRL